MSQPAPLMPKATAIWLVDNTGLTFDQIANFCKLHPLEVKAIADGDASTGIKGHDPIQSGQITREEIALGESNGAHVLRLAESKYRVPEKKRKGARYTPVSRRQDKPNAILWIVRNHPEIKDAQIIRLIGTTKHTIATVRDRSHWNSTSLTPQDPVTLGLCSQLELDMEVSKSAKHRPVVAESAGQTLLPAEETTHDSHDYSNTNKDEIDVAKVFAKLKGMGEQPDY